MSKRNTLALFFSILSFILFLPGISLPMLKLKTAGRVETEISSPLNMQLYDTSNSILKAVKHLFLHNNRFVASMIFTFSVIVPIIKAILLTYVLLSAGKYRRQIYDFTKSLSKWAMCDIYVVATYLVFFSSSAGRQHKSYEVDVMDYSVDIDMFINTQAKLEIGFFIFTAYCLASLISFQLYDEEELLHRNKSGRHA